ncbi:MAG: rod shape-determining protein RodA [Halothiobacillaceae bacterium]|nr:MAG: rod shape-determining protein RodA [Halothiobacillaceae bacterium]
MQPYREGDGALFHWLRLDPWLLFALLLLLGAGAVTVYSASHQSMAQLTSLAARIGLGLTLMLVMARIPPRIYLLWSPWLFGAGLALLVAVELFGHVGKGAQRWLDLGFIRFQPSEMMKLAVPMMAAWYLSQRTLPPRPLDVLVTLALVLAPMGLIMLQPDLGTALLVGAAGIFILLLAGLSWRYIAGGLLALAAIIPVMWSFVLHDYQKQRVMTLLDPEADPLGAGYHIIQSKIAIGSGGVFGKGWLNSTQSGLDFLPEGHTDFIFAVYAEEFGLIGVALLLALYLFIILRGLVIAVQAPTVYGRLLAGSLSLSFFVYVFVNTGMVTGLLPVVGVPLPLVSYGGTAMVTLMAGFGMLMSIHSHRPFLAAR